MVANHRTAKREAANILSAIGAALTVALVLGSIAWPSLRQRHRVTPAASNRETALVPTISPAWLRISALTAVGVVFTALGYRLVRMWPSPIVYSDSGTILSISRKLAQGDISPVVQTQSPPLQDGIYALFLRFGLSGEVHLPVLIASGLLALVLGAVVYRVTEELASMALPAVVLLYSEIFWVQSAQLAFYPVFALLGYAGLYFCIEFIVVGGRWPKAFCGASLVAGAVYAFTIALIFVIVPALALAAYFSRERSRRSITVYVPLAVLLSPWIVWHLLVGGIEYFYYHPLDWFTMKYQGMVHPTFWGNGEDASTIEYARAMFQVVSSRLIETPLFAFAAIGLLYVQRRLGTRALGLCMALLILHILALMVTRPATHARYHYPALPLLVLLVSAGIYGSIAFVFALTREKADPARTGTKVALIAGTIAVALMSFLAAPDGVSLASRQYVDRLENDKTYRDLQNMAAIISATDGGVIARDSAIQHLVPDNQVVTHFLMPEADYVTYLSWPSDTEVANTLRRHGIEWVLIRNNPLRWERNYNMWLDMAYGVEPRHYLAIATSPEFLEVYAGPAYRLYHLREPENGLRD